MAHKEGPQLLRIWDDWSAGIGYLEDDGYTKGMYSANAILGLLGELRPAPLATSVALSAVETHMNWSPTTANTFWAYAGISIKPIASGTVAIGSGQTFTALNQASPYTNSYTAPAFANQVMLVFINTGDVDNNVTAVTYGGVALTEAIESNAAGTNISIWYLINPTYATPLNLVVTYSITPTDIAVRVQVLRDAHQTTPNAGTDKVMANAATRQAASIALAGVANGMAFDCYGQANVGDTPVPNPRQTSLTTWDGLAMDGGVSYKAVGSGDPLHAQYFIEAIQTTDPTVPFMYACFSTEDSYHAVAKARKLSLAYATFGSLYTDSQVLARINTPAGQPALYQGLWYFPAGNDRQPTELTTIGSGAISTDTWSQSDAVGHAGAAHHFTNLSHQLARLTSEGMPSSGFMGGGSPANLPGAALLKLNGNPTVTGDWGSAFQVGDKRERPAGMQGLQNLVFVMNREGLFSFDSRGRSGLVFEDFRSWRSIFSNIPLSPWRGGLVIPHPSGLLFYTPGRLPVNIGIDGRLSMWGVPPSGATELRSGRHHSTAPVGDFVYSIYQPDVSSTTALVLVGYGEPDRPVWQCLNSITLPSANLMARCHVSLLGQPISASYVTPSLWYTNATNLDYIVLDSRASPFRARADIHKIVLSGNAYFSQVFFQVPIEISHFVVYAEDMASGDEWQLSYLANNGSERKVSGPVIADGRFELPCTQKDVSYLMLRMGWIATSAAARVPPRVKRVEVWGWPE